MTVAVLIMGRIFAAAVLKASKGGKPYASAAVKVADGNEIEFWSALAFGDEAREALLALVEGETVALQGTPKIDARGVDAEGRPKIWRTLFVEAILSGRPKPRKRQLKTGPAPSASPSPSAAATGSFPFDDAVPFASEWR